MYDTPKQLAFPQCVIFDLDNTLYPYLPSHKAGMKSVEEKLSMDYGVDLVVFAENFALAREEIKQRLGQTASSHSRLLYFMRTLELLGFKSQPLLALDLEQTYWRSFLKKAELFPDVVSLFEFLKASDVSLAIVTDLTTQIQLRKIIHFDLDKYVDVIVTSEEAGVEKSQFVPFELALKKLNIPAQKTWVVGDDAAADIAPAIHLSMTAAFKASSGTKSPAGTSIHFQKFDELKNKLENLWFLAEGG